MFSLSIDGEDTFVIIVDGAKLVFTYGSVHYCSSCRDGFSGTSCIAILRNW